MSSLIPSVFSTGIYIVYDPDSYMFVLLSAVICSFDDIRTVQLYCNVFMTYIYIYIYLYIWQCGVRRRFEAALLLGSPVQFPVRTWIFLLCRQRPPPRADHSFRGVLPGVYVS